jgi:hypothetical protein
MPECDPAADEANQGPTTRRLIVAATIRTDCYRHHAIGHDIGNTPIAA